MSGLFDVGGLTPVVTWKRVDVVKESRTDYYLRVCAQSGQPSCESPVDVVWVRQGGIVRLAIVDGEYCWQRVCIRRSSEDRDLHGNPILTQSWVPVDDGYWDTRSMRIAILECLMDVVKRLRLYEG